ncbi:MAG: LacI family DNA-binding transcriptional regulator [Lentisphaeria bacterium]|nr:LacI family DNA-binding transcriptional regulator [Lentisphaeria bacterium]
MKKTVFVNGKKATLRDIAELAGVTHSTVSRILGGNPHFSASRECRLRILKIAEECGYQPKLSAKSLASGKSYNVNLLLGSISRDLTIPSNAILIDTIARELKKNHYNLVLTPITVSDIDTMTREVRKTLGSASVDGTIIGGGLLNKELRAEFIANRVPAVLLDIHSMEEDFGRLPFIYHLAYDEYPGQEAMLKHLMSLGHRKIAYITEGACPDIMSAFRQAADRCDFKFSGRDVFQFYDWRHHGPPPHGLQLYYYRKMQQAWPALEKYTALVCTSQIGVLGIIEFLKDRGLSVGKDVSVVGYGNFAAVGADVTSIDKSWDETGKTAVEIILHAIAHPGEPVKHVKIPTRLRIGTTTGTVRMKSRISRQIKKGETV